MSKVTFTKAVPVWKKTQEMNDHLIFIGKLGATDKALIRLSANYFYRLSVNGDFVAFGPARAAYGYSRVDTLSLDGLLTKPENEIRLEVAGYNCRCLSTCMQPAFLCCEVVVGGECVLFTGRDFTCYENDRHVQKTMRYSIQRHFTEVYDLFKPQLGSAVDVAEVKAPVFLERQVPYVDYEQKNAELFGKGTFSYDEDPPSHPRYSNSEKPDYWGSFDYDEIRTKPLYWAQKQRFVDCDKAVLPVSLSENEYALFDFGKIETGFISLTATAETDCDIVLLWTELGSAASYEFTGSNTHDVIEYYVPAGTAFTISSFEPYTAKKIAVMLRQGRATVSSVMLTTYERSAKGLVEHKVADDKLREIYDAGVRTYRQNAVDLYSDCPSRERAGWLCDSFFTGRAEHFLYGDSKIEDAFLENYRLFTNHEVLYPDGVVPMCYPSDSHYNGNGTVQFIPQWAMWYVIEVFEYLTERNTAADKSLFRDSIYGVLSYLEKFENEYGLLEKLESWNFVEWSKANSWTNDVNFPTNFLYSRVLECVGTLYDDEALLSKATTVRTTSREMSFDGQVFIDNAVRDERGKLVVTRNCSEACQYYALLFGGVSLNDERYAFLKKQVHEKFLNFDNGERDFCSVNAFIGLYLRIVFLMDYGDGQLLKDDLIYFFGGMAAETGTLWENRQRGIGSHNHGFASLACVAIAKAEQMLK